MNDLGSLNRTGWTLLRVPVRDDSGELTGEVLEHKIYALGYDDWAPIQSWVNTQFPDPFDTARDAIENAVKQKRPFNVEQEKFLIKMAYEKALAPAHLIGTQEVDPLINSLEGTKQIILASIRLGNPAFTEDDAARLCKYMTPIDVIKAQLATQYDLIRNDPKAEPLNGNSTKSLHGSSGSRRTRRAAKKPRTTG